MDSEALLEALLRGYKEGALRDFFARFSNYAPASGGEGKSSWSLLEDPKWGNMPILWGLLRDPDWGDMPILVRPVDDADRHRVAFKELGERLAKDNFYGGVVLLHDPRGNYRLGYIELLYRGRRKPRPFGRSVLVRKEAPNKTARQRLKILVQKAARFEPLTLEALREALSVDAVTEAFYREFVRVFEEILVPGVRGVPEERKRDFVLAFVARTFFVAFVAKRGWLGSREDFLPWLFSRYGQEGARGAGNFYHDWLKPLFFQAFRAPPGRKPNAFAHLPPDVREIYSHAPYLNGELFREKGELDLPEAFLTDEAVSKFYEFLFAYNFTVEENTAYEVDLELNPEFLGLILERLVNSVGVEGRASELGAHYTPRTEVDLICRLALAERLHREGLPLEKAYALLGGDAEELSQEERQKARLLLLDAKVLDPAVGSGAFLVGMLQVLEEALDLLGEPKTLERKKRILQNLHGVDVLSWAVWMAELRLWLAYFLELPEEEKNSSAPLLPSLGLKVVRGDSVVQVVGTHAVPTRLDLDRKLLQDKKVKQAMDALLEAKEGYFHNRGVTERKVRERERAFLLTVLDKKYGTGQGSLGLDGVRSRVDAYLEEERRVLEEILQREDRPFLYLVDFAEILVGRGGFDIVVGNPPYVRQEEIQDPTGQRGAEDYKALLREEAWRDVKGLLPQKDAEAFPQPPGRADLYVYFYARTLALLNPKGVHAFVVSNSWLDVQYGAWLQRIFLELAPLRYVIENRVKRSFRADVNTVITVAHAPQPGKKVPGDWPVLFVAVKRPFEEVDLVQELLEAQMEVRHADDA
ncbi:Eco57I restriction endonuclease (plasmid) [Thermus oshimai JL-2]|uniref:site-specific DNA-methyltransferase (adenine-specific) n=2 Tax=Thermus oshimai TaxID=56957 RepID=K7QX31_THEOS|nr:Eco57I restriction endonuclease [Thermus oshimai JL-2]